uniref:C-type lectin domain-containing protein n=2 Tax=Acrobeloides nanus TaxID=290746 RepID=A0A914CHT6_9BILA
MRLASVLLIFSIFHIYLLLNVDSHKERECGCNYGRIWVDIVLLIDHSSNVEQTEMQSLLQSILTMFSHTSINPARNESVRIAVANFARNIVSLADLTQINSIEDLEKILLKVQRNTLISDVNTGLALNWASVVFEMSDRRPNAKNVVVLYSSAYSQGNVQDPMQSAIQLKSQGVTIITVAIKGAAWPTLSLLASPDNGFSVTGSDVNTLVLNAFCQANCFCKSGFTRLVDSSGHQYGECVAVTNNVNNWVSASVDCSSWYRGSFLASEFSSFKHSFILNLTKPLKLDSYFIGLSYNKFTSGYQWQQPNGTIIALDSTFLPWLTGYPNNMYGDCVKIIRANNPSAQNMVWMNAHCYEEVANYVCQMNTCDTNNYCATLNDYD